MKRKITLTAINSRYSHLNPVPYYLREVLKGFNFDVEILQFNINLNSIDILSEIIETNPDVVGFSVYIWNSEITKNIVKDLKKILPNSIVIAGGPEAAYNKEWESFADYIVKGQGEGAIACLAENNFSLNLKILENKSCNFTNIKFPYNKDDLFAFENKYVYYEATRGCPYRCSYCISSREDQTLEFRDLKLVFNELDFFLQSNCKVIKFVDRSFNCNRKFSREIWKYLINNYKEGVKFHFEIYPALLEEEDFQILKKVPDNYFQFEIGVQSVNEKTLKAVNRFENPKKVEANVIKLVKLKNIHIHLDLIVGLPFEGYEEVKYSFNKIFKMGGNHFQLGFLKVLKGTEMEKRQDEFEMKVTSLPPYEILQNKWLAFSEINLLRKIENILEVYSNSGKFNNTLQFAIKCFESPFDFFERFAMFCSKDISIKGQSNSFLAFFLFLTEKMNCDKSVVLDCLRLDWFECGNFVNVLKFLRTGFEGCRKMPKPIEDYIESEIKGCFGKAYVKLLSDYMREECGKKEYVFFYRQKDKQVVKVFL
jgi:hypothetical protein